MYNEVRETFGTIRQTGLGSQLCELQGESRIANFSVWSASVFADVIFVHSERRIKSRFMRTSQHSKTSFKRNAKRFHTLFTQCALFQGIQHQSICVNPHRHPTPHRPPTPHLMHSAIDVSSTSCCVQNQVENFYLQTLEKVALHSRPAIPVSVHWTGNC